MKRGKNTKGITLIALVVTIIVLLILAGVVISMATGNNGILNKAAEAKVKTDEAKVEEEMRLAKLEAVASMTDTEIREYKEIDSKGNERKAAILPGIALKPSGQNHELRENKIETGLVAIDQYENEYVWIEVPKDEEKVYKNAKMNITNFTNEEYTKIYNDLYEYCKTYNSLGDDTDGDEWYGWDDDKDGVVESGEIITKAMADEDSSLKSNNSGCGLTYNEYYELKKKMLKSIYINGGFWIGRYETGYEALKTSDFRTYSTTRYITPKVQKNLYPYNYVTCSDAQKLSSKINSNYITTSSLMFGIQWNLVCKYLEENAVELGSQKENRINAIKANSTSWGNYINASFTINKGKYRDSDTKWIEISSKLESESRMLTTGASDRNKVLNIYDFAGNMWEWTLQHAIKYPEKPCAFRGGYFNNNGSATAIPRRSYGPDYKVYYYSFRVALY